MIEERYTKTVGTLTPDEANALHHKRVCIAGCGGLGGNVLEMLARIGVLNITVVDGDVFAESNLNRQVLCTENNIGEYKTDHAVQRVNSINSTVKIVAQRVFLDDANATEILRDHDVIIDALDNVPSRLLLEKHAEALNIPLIHGAIHGWMAQVAVVIPGDQTISKLYSVSSPPPPSTPSFTPTLCAAIQVSETIKLLCGKQTIARGQLLVFDLFDNSVYTLAV